MHLVSIKQYSLNTDIFLFIYVVEQPIPVANYV